MTTRKLIILFLFVFTFSACGLFEHSNEPEPLLFRTWYKTEQLETAFPSPKTKIHGWNISQESVWSDNAVGSFQPIGINDETGGIDLIDTRYMPDIHHVDSKKIIVDYFDHPVIVTDTVRYYISGDVMILKGKYYNGTFTRSDLGKQVFEAYNSEFEVTIDSQRSSNLRVANRIPSAFISRISPGHIKLISKMAGENVSIDIHNFDGPGIYSIGIKEASYSTYGTDWLGVPYQTQSDSSGYIMLEYHAEENRYSGLFSFSAYRDGPEENSEKEKTFTDGMFDLPVFE